MAPRTENPYSMPASSEHVCQLAESGRWDVMAAAVFSKPVSQTIIKSPKDEKLVVNRAIQDGQWDFLRSYTSLGYIRIRQTFEDVLLEAMHFDMFQFIKDSLLQFSDRFNYRPVWLVTIVILFCSSADGLRPAKEVVPLLREDTPVDDIRRILKAVQETDTDYQIDKEALLLELSQRFSDLEGLWEGSSSERSPTLYDSATEPHHFHDSGVDIYDSTIPQSAVRR